MTSRLIIDLDAVAHNYRAIAGEAAGAEVAPVVKADGYGLGAGPIARKLWDEGARSFFVARLVEGEALRRALGARQATIFVLDGLTDGGGEAMAKAGLTPVINRPEHLAHWRGDFALHVDTGMNRLGVSLDEAAALAASGASPCLVMSHLGSAEQPDNPRNGEQLARFRQARALFAGVKASLSASSGAFLGPDYRFDQVRPGISLYGGGPREVPDPRIRAVATLSAPILQLRDLKAGEKAGYGATFTARGDMRLAVVGCGYADGIIRQSHKGAAGWLHGSRSPFCFVTMDLIGIDVSGVAAVAVGDRVELLGENAKLDDLAKAAGSVAHECLTRLSPRGERAYLGEAP